jgi:two-component system, NarL family, nitrate/nitrite response regulator NarL
LYGNPNRCGCPSKEISPAISVLLADDSKEFRRAIRRLLEPQSEISLVGAATDFSEAVLFAALLRPDVVLLDLRMKDSQGLDALGASPQIISTGSTIIAISFSVDDDAKALARKIGAAKLLDKTSL